MTTKGEWQNAKKSRYTPSSDHAESWHRLLAHPLPGVQLKYRHIGTVGNRVIAVVGVPGNSSICYAGAASEGIFKSFDGGTTWTRFKGKGLPEGEVGKVAVAVAPSDSDRVYVLIEHKDEGLWRSDDGEQNWKIISPDLSTNDKSKQERTGGTTLDDASPLYCCTLFAIADSPLERD